MTTVIVWKRMYVNDRSCTHRCNSGGKNQNWFFRLSLSEMRVQTNIFIFYTWRTFKSLSGLSIFIVFLRQWGVERVNVKFNVICVHTLMHTFFGMSGNYLHRRFSFSSGFSWICYMGFGIEFGWSSVITCTKTNFWKNFGINNNNVYWHKNFWLEILDTCVLEP